MYGSVAAWRIRGRSESRNGRKSTGPLWSWGTVKGASNTERSNVVIGGGSSPVPGGGWCRGIPWPREVPRTGRGSIAPRRDPTPRGPWPEAALMHRRLPPDAWLTARLGKDLELDQPEELLPVPGRGDAKPQRPRRVGTQDEVRRTPHPQESPEHGLTRIRSGGERSMPAGDRGASDLIGELAVGRLGVSRASLPSAARPGRRDGRT